MSTFLVNKNVTSLYVDSSCRDIATQAILGTAVTVLEEKGEFCLVLTPDLYEGWLSSQHLSRIKLEGKRARVKRFIANVYTKPRRKGELLTKLVLARRAAANLR